MRKSKRQKKTKPIGKVEFIFNIISLLAVIGVGIYFGIRSFYYYNVENFRVEEESKTLNGSIINNNKITSADGLHQDTEGHYFKGHVSNNYVKFANRLFRVIRINKNGTVKVISEDIVASFLWGEESSYANSNLKSWLSTDETGVYYKTLPNPQNYLAYTNYSEDRLSSSKVISNMQKEKDYLTTLTIADYSTAGGKESFLNNNHAFWVIGIDQDANNLFIDTDGSIESALSYEAYGVRVVLTFKKDINIASGDGTIENPYLINQNNDTNYVDSYVKLGEDIWKVNYDDGNVLKMYLTRTVNTVGSIYGTKNLYDYNDLGSLANYFNFNYFPSLPYNSIINDTIFQTGEVSEEFSYKYSNIYASNVICKVGMLNMFDYYTGNLDNFYLMNTTSTVGSMVYVYHNNGILEEVMVNDQRLAIPVISINKALLKNGTGTLDNPYVID